MALLSLTFQDKTGSTRRDVTVSHAVIAGWTGRDRAAVEKHIVELEELGIPRPKTIPIYFRMAASRITTADTIEVLGAKSSGEVEFVLLQTGGKLWVGTGSDHTDREVETYGITVSKHMCEHPIASTFWDYESVAPHWDKLILRARITEGGQSVLYQEGAVAAMLTPNEVISQYAAGGGRLAEDSLMFCGTFAAHGGIRPSEKFEFELEDPVLKRKLQHSYRVVSLPING